MKNILVFVVMLTATYTGNSQSLIGAWEAVIDNHSGRQKVVVVFSENHQSASKYDFNSGAFLSTNGGTYTLSGTTVTEVVEFDSNSPERVGSEVSFEIELEDDAMTIKDIDVIWKRIDDGKGPLSGAWLISGRMRNGELRKRETSGPRKTMKTNDFAETMALCDGIESGLFPTPNPHRSTSGLTVPSHAPSVIS